MRRVLAPMAGVVRKDVRAMLAAQQNVGYNCLIGTVARTRPRQLVQRLQGNTLPFSQRSMDIVKDITLQEDTLGYRLHGKTGWAMNSTDGSTGWFVGWVEKADSTGPFFFANRAHTPDTLSETFGPARRAISIEVLRRMGVVR